MASSKKKFVLVAFITKEDAEKALQSAWNYFAGQGIIDVGHLSHCDDNIVHFQVTDPRAESVIRRFLLKQDGSLPDGCLVKCNEA